MSEYRELLLGCGHKKDKRFVIPGTPANWQNLITLDMNADCHPTIVGNLDTYKWTDCLWYGKDGEIVRWVPDSFDEVHAYEVLEHLGSQGDYQAFFATFAMIWHVLKPNGYLVATTPSTRSQWLWGDPGHRRTVQRESLVFLDQTNYLEQIGNTAMSDYRFCYKADFKLMLSQDNGETHQFVLQAIKPARASVESFK